ncbi:MAG: hypothetical protein ABI822_32255, partial [Bryobacteraceae bacterium]
TSSCTSFLSLIAESAVEVDQWQLEKLALVAQKYEILFYTPGLPADFHQWLWGKAPSTLELAIAELTAGLPEGAKIALMPEGPYVLAKASTPQLEEVSV